MFLAVYCMAVWRISSLLVHEKGPWRVFFNIRERAGILHDDQGKPFMYPDGFFSELLQCIWCTSLWVAAGMAILTYFFPSFAYRFAVCFAFSTGAIVLDAIVSKLNQRS